MSETDREGHPPKRLEQEIAVFGDELAQQEAAAAGRGIRPALIHDERARREQQRQKRFAEQLRRNQLGIGTPPSESLDDWDATLCEEFIELLAKVRDEQGVDGFEHAIALPTTGGDRVRGFFIGCAGEQPQDSGSIGTAAGLYLCDDGTLRTFRADRTAMRNPQMALQGVPLNHEGEFAKIHPGHFTEKTVPRRQFVSTKGGKVPALPPGVESAGPLYKSGAAYYQTYQVHSFEPESLGRVLAATAHYVIEEGRPRPVYDPFGPSPVQ